MQVSSALSYLHTTKNIVHFDINPDNILVFKYPQAGHFCFSKKTSLTCESCYSEGGGVLVKLADLGISALVGPSGFQRKSSTPTYAAPEVIKYSGKEPLTEKVIMIYSLHKCMCVHYCSLGWYLLFWNLIVWNNDTEEIATRRFIIEF